MDALAAVSSRSNAHQTLLERIKTRQAVVGIIGLGYVGLPLAIRCAEEGFSVIGFDLDSVKVKRINEGESYIGHISSSSIGRLIQTKHLEATSEFERLADVDCVVICVPTPLTSHREPDLSYIAVTAETIARYLRVGQLISLESTTYPGTTEEILWPRLEATGLAVGRDYFLIFSPERENPGNAKYSLEQIPKVIGGVTAGCLEIGRTFYGSFIRQTVGVSSTKTAEMTKLLENIFRCVNIALVNELKMLCDKMGIDIWEVIRAASTKPFGFMPFYPGPGLGGHCIPIDPFYLTWKAREYDITTRFIELAGEINAAMPEYVVHKTIEALNRQEKSIKGARVLLLGVSYKKDVGDIRESPALKILELLHKQGARLLYHDPYIPSFGNLRHYHFAMESVPLTDDLIAEMDVVMISVDHSNVDYKNVVEKAKLVVDTRNVTANFNSRKNVVKA